MLTDIRERGILKKVRVIARRTLRAFSEIHTDSTDALNTWYFEARNAVWENPADIKKKYRSASILKKGRVVFNINGNKYRLLCFVNYEQKIVYIKFIGTHKAYNAITMEDYDGDPVKGS